MSDNEQAPEGENELGILWGAADIGAAIGVNPRRCHYMLSENELTGAKKVGGRWCISRRRLKQIFEPTLQ